MAMFDPKKAKEENANRGLPSGPYLLAVSSFDRKTSKAGKEYLNARIVVIAGPAKKRSFFDNISLDQNNKGAMFRLSMLAEQCGVEAAFDLDDDAAIRENLVGRPFKAQVSLKHENGYTNNGIERYITGDKVTEKDREAMEQWVIDAEAEGEWSGSSRSNDGPPDDDDAPHPADSDDIPF